MQTNVRKTREVVRNCYNGLKFETGDLDPAISTLKFQNNVEYLEFFNFLFFIENIWSFGAAKPLFLSLKI